MKEVYMRPEAEVISFAPSKAIALENPGWEWDEDAFSPQEVNTVSDENDYERRDGYEG